MGCQILLHGTAVTKLVTGCDDPETNHRAPTESIKYFMDEAGVGKLETMETYCTYLACKGRFDGIRQEMSFRVRQLLTPVRHQILRARHHPLSVVGYCHVMESLGDSVQCGICN